MPSGKVLDTEQKGQIKILSSQGYYPTEIGRLIFKSDKVVRNFLKNMEAYGTKLTGGPKFMIDGRLLSRILRYLDKEPLSIPEIIDYFELTVSEATLGRALKRGEAEFSLVLRSPYLRPMHIRTRLTWCKGHIDRNTDWSLVVFTDEKKFNLHGNDGPKRAWKRKGSPNHEILVNKNDRRSVMVWRGISLCGRTELEIMVGEPVNAERYCTTLATKFVDFQ